MSTAAFGLACLGFMLMSLSMKRHFRRVFAESTDYSQWVVCNRILGYVLIFLSLIPCIIAYDTWIGLVLWLSILALAAFLQIFLLTYWPSRSLLFSGASIVLVLGGLFL